MSWAKAINFTLRWEGGYVNHPLDKGGATNRGITQSALNRAYAQGIVSHKNVSALSKAEAEAIYKANYWTPYQFETFAEPVDMIMFDLCVNHGSGGAAKIAQRACVSFGIDVKIDGVWGAQTRKAVFDASWSNAAYFAKLLLIKRLAYYNSIVASNPQQRVFLKGWQNRTNALAKEAGVNL